MLICHLGIVFDADALLATVLPTCDPMVTTYLWESRSCVGSGVLPRKRQDGPRWLQKCTILHQQSSRTVEVDANLLSCVHLNANALLTTILPTCDRTITTYLRGSRSSCGEHSPCKNSAQMAATWPKMASKSAQCGRSTSSRTSRVDADLASWFHLSCQCSADNCSAGNCYGNMRPYDHHLPLGL